jgi:hypothetical protein
MHLLWGEGLNSMCDVCVSLFGCSMCAYVESVAFLFPAVTLVDVLSVNEQSHSVGDPSLPWSQTRSLK